MINLKFGNILRKDFRDDINHFEQDVIDKLLNLQDNNELLSDTEAVIEFDAKDYGINKHNLIKIYKLANELDVNLDIVDGKIKIFYNQPFDWTASNKKSVLINRFIELIGQLIYTVGFTVFGLIFLILIWITLLPLSTPKSLLVGLSMLLTTSCCLIISGFLIMMITRIIRVFMLKHRAFKKGENVE